MLDYKEKPPSGTEHADCPSTGTSLFEATCLGTELEIDKPKLDPGSTSSPRDREPARTLHSTTLKPSVLASCAGVEFRYFMTWCLAEIGRKGWGAQLCIFFVILGPEYPSPQKAGMYACARIRYEPRKVKVKGPRRYCECGWRN